jgi:hypothetical protein
MEPLVGLNRDKKGREYLKDKINELEASSKKNEGSGWRV